MIAQCAVTFEFEHRRPLTWRGEVEALKSSTVVHRAAQIAAKELKPREWASMVVVILSRSEAKEEDNE